MDVDLEGMSRDQLIAEVKYLRLGIREDSGALVATARAKGSTSYRSRLAAISPWLYTVSTIT
jgi:hypothetical protein